MVRAHHLHRIHRDFFAAPTDHIPKKERVRKKGDTKTQLKLQSHTHTHTLGSTDARLSCNHTLIRSLSRTLSLCHHTLTLVSVHPHRCLFPKSSQGSLIQYRKHAEERQERIALSCTAFRRGSARARRDRPLCRRRRIRYADELLAALDERDAQCAASTSAPQPIHRPAMGKAPSESSAKDRIHTYRLRGAGERMINGLRHHGHHDNDAANQDAAPVTGTSPSQRRNSIRKLFGRQSQERRTITVRHGTQEEGQPSAAAKGSQGSRGGRDAQAGRGGSEVGWRQAGRGRDGTPGHLVHVCGAGRVDVRDQTRTDTASTLRSPTSSTCAGRSTRPPTTKPRDERQPRRCARTRTNTNPSSRTRTSTWRHRQQGGGHAQHRAGAGEALSRLLQRRREHGCVGRTTRDSRPVEGIPHPDQCGSSRACRCSRSERESSTENRCSSPTNRKMYGLGEHYNSLRPASAAIARVTPNVYLVDFIRSSSSQRSQCIQTTPRPPGFATGVVHLERPV